MKLKVKFHSIDFWSRPIFVTTELEEPIYLSSVDILAGDYGLHEETQIIAFFKKYPERLSIHGKDLDADPLGTKIGKHVELIFE
jgi:hypothetical protein